MDYHVYVVDGEDHAQEAYYNEQTQELIITNPAHSGFSDSITLITSKDENGDAKILTCYNDECHYHEAHDEMGLNPRKYVRLSKSLKQTRVNADDATNIYVIRSDHSRINETEYESLPETMKKIRLYSCIKP